MPIRSATLPGRISLKIPKPVRSTVFGANCHAIAVLGCRIASGVEAKTVAEMRLNGGIQRLIHIVRDRTERAAQDARFDRADSADWNCMCRARRMSRSASRVTFQVSCA